ncbi:hypothetical protein V6N13_107732 [Hibiscus sabdariffa]|uniref:Uncharacterized protein n=1 Tax=Hibiscus sabdariffa TaxID=183260 RepID=A0ABR2SQ54_9ROSI
MKATSSVAREFGPSPNFPKNGSLEKEMGKDHIVKDDGANLVDSFKEQVSEVGWMGIDALEEVNQDNLREGNPMTIASTSIVPLKPGKGVKLGSLDVRVDAEFFAGPTTLKMIYSRLLHHPCHKWKRLQLEWNLGVQMISSWEQEGRGNPLALPKEKRRRSV